MKILFRNSLCLFGLFMSGILSPVAAQSDIYQEGQVWIIESGEFQGTEVIIAHIEDHPIQNDVIHIMIPGPIENSQGLVSSDMSHIPFAEQGLLKSDLNLYRESETVGESWKAGYEIWNEAALKDEAGIFTISVSEVMDTMFSQLAILETETSAIIESKEPVSATVVSPIISEADDLPFSVNSSPKIIDPNDEVFGEVQHAGFSDNFLARIKATTDLFEEVDGISFEKAVATYESELDPASSLAVFEEMARVYGEYCEMRCLDLATKKEVYQVVLFAGMLPADDVVELMKVDAITKDDIREIVSQYKLEPDVIEKIEDLE